jgi:thymidylate synthase
MISDTKTNCWFIDANAAYNFMISQLGRAPSVKARGKVQKEILFEDIGLLDPQRCIVANEKRKFKPLYGVAEFLWYISGVRRVNNIGKCARLWEDISDEKGEVESNYGHVIFEKQWRHVIKILSNDSYSRRGVLNIYTHERATKNINDVPCTLSIQFMIRKDKLHMRVVMRSNDIIYGFCNDVFAFSLFQQMMLNELRRFYPKLVLGKYIHSVGSLHIYADCYEHLDCDVYKPSPYYIILKPEWTYDRIKENWALPPADMTKQQIYAHCSQAWPYLFETNYKLKWETNNDK